MVGATEEDFDLIGIAEDELEARVQVFYVRKGRVVGRKGLVVDKVEDVETPGARRAASSSSSTPTPTGDDIPKEILVPVEPDDHELYEEFLALEPRLARSRIRVPQRGAQARAARRRRRSTRGRRSRGTSCGARPTTTRARGRCVALQEALDLPEAPLRIECFDISNLQGTEIVGVDGGDGRRPAEALRLPPLQGARPSTARTTSPSMEEVLTRRFRNYLRERDEGAHAGQAVRVPAEPAR